MLCHSRLAMPDQPVTKSAELLPLCADPMSGCAISILYKQGHKKAWITHDQSSEALHQDQGKVCYTSGRVLCTSECHATTWLAVS